MEAVKYHIKKISIQSLGVAFVLLGIAGLVLPILQGILFIVVGLCLLSIYSSRAKFLLHRFGQVHPRARGIVEGIERCMTRVFGV